MNVSSATDGCEDLLSLDSACPLRPPQTRDENKTTAKTPHSPTPDTIPGPVSSFRNVSACSRCRVRKHRCDQRLPKCHSCEKARVRCVGYDPITKQEIPRSYVYFLEKRVQYLSDLLLHHNIDYKPAVACEGDEVNPEDDAVNIPAPAVTSRSLIPDKTSQNTDGSYRRLDMEMAFNYNGGSSECRIGQSSDSLIFNLLLGRTTRREIMRRDRKVNRIDIDGPIPAQNLSQSLPNLPNRGRVEELAEAYFQHANVHLPALQRCDFEQALAETSSARESDRSPHNLFLLFIVFAIGAALPSPAQEEHPNWRTTFPSKRQRASRQLATPEDFHSSAVAQLERLLTVSSSGQLDDLSELQAVILLATFSVYKPTNPGLEHLVNRAMRSAIGLRLYCERDGSVDNSGRYPLSHNHRVQDWRRRLWWCVYSLDRLVAPYLGRPVLIPDEVVTVKFPFTHEDHSIPEIGLSESSGRALGVRKSTHHWFKLRILQSEIHCVLQYRQAQAIRDEQSGNLDCKTPLFIKQHVSFPSWQDDMTRRLDEWKDMIPDPGIDHLDGPMAVCLELEYWQSIIQLYRWSITVPARLISLSITAHDTFRRILIETPENCDIVSIKISEAARNVLRLLSVLQNANLVNVTYLSAQDIFVAGSLLLFTCWNSSKVRHSLAIQDLDYALLAATSALKKMTGSYAPANDFRSALEKMGFATIRLRVAAMGLRYPYIQSVKASCRTREKSPLPFRKSFDQIAPRILTSSAWGHWTDGFLPNDEPRETSNNVIQPDSQLDLLNVLTEQQDGQTESQASIGLQSDIDTQWFDGSIWEDLAPEKASLFEGFHPSLTDLESLTSTIGSSEHVYHIVDYVPKHTSGESEQIMCWGDLGHLASSSSIA